MPHRNHSNLPRIEILLETTISWSRSLIKGILNYSSENGPWYIHLEPHLISEKLSTPKGWKGDGIIARITTNEMAKNLSTLNIPIINVSSIQLKDTNYPRVIKNPASEGKFAYEVFQKRGFRNFAYIGKLKEGYVNRHHKEYEHLLSDKGYKIHLYNARLEKGIGNQERLTEWLKSLPKPVGIFCWGPSLGHRVIDACQQSGINVPHEVAVLGSDYDELLSVASYPPQSGLKVNTEQIGWTAASILDSLMKGESIPQNEWLLEPREVIETLSIDTIAVNDKKLSDIMRYIRTNATEQITVDDILEKFPMARRSLERKFRQHFDCSIIEHIRKLRINRARTLLVDTDLPITQISEECGFSSYNYLNRIFKSETGLSPRNYRNQHRIDSAEK